MASPAIAQDGVLSPGDALITQFSGLKTAPDGAPLPDPDGVSVRTMGLGNPGFPADGSIWSNAPQVFTLTARDIGQVFGSAFDDQSPADAYLAATSAFGLYRNSAGDGWADGMWGEGGGPGTIWKLEAANNYRPVPLANVTTEGRENGGVGLGGLTFDPWHRQLFVADLESGLIHRVALDNGDTLQTFDHGLDGRSYFLDMPSGQYLVLDVVSEDSTSAPDFDSCTDASGAAAQFSETPACWNYADFRRRVWGLGVQRDPVTDTIRLYYAVWGGAALGSSGWDTAGDDARTAIWSVRLDGNGGFDLTDVRREFIVPPLVPDVEGEAQFATPPVTEIAFSSDGSMLLAERGRPAPDFSATPPQLVAPRSARVMRFLRNEDGVWETEGRYDVGFPERGLDMLPHIRANATGGVSLGNGYTDSGDIDPQAPDATVWMSADPLCAPDGPCIDRQTGQASIDGPIGGFQGTPVSATSELVPAVAIQPYPTTGGPVTPAEGPLASYLIPTPDTGAIVGAMGDITVYRAEPPTQVVEAPEEVPEELLEELPDEIATPQMPLADLAVAKTGLGRCAPGGECVYQVSVTNIGPVDHDGPIFLTDTIGSPGVSLVGATSDPWDCYSADGNIFCQYPFTTLSPGAGLSFNITLRPGVDHREPRLNNCVAVTWLGLQGRDRIRAVQAELNHRGFDPGSADGIMGPNTARAIRNAETAAGITPTGKINPTFIDALFGPGANQDGDASPANDQDCGLVSVDVPLPPAHQVQVSGFHRRFDSVNHDPRTSAPLDVHDVELSYFHRTWRSSLHDTAYSHPIPIHRVALSRFHLTWGSGLHDSIYTRLVPIHSVLLSGFHDSYRSILHDYRTSMQFPTHRHSMSGFHRSWNSSRHDGIVTRVIPIHWVQLSAFHRRFASGLHDNAVTRLRPVHNAGLSNFHNFNQSSLHDPLTTRLRPIHRPVLSRFHRNQISAQHNPVTTQRQPIHLNNISNFHRTFVSGQHQPLTTQMRPIHAVGLSNFHRNSASSVHNPRTTQPTIIHRATLSGFHRTNLSGVHNSTTSQLRPVHQPAASRFHQNGVSRLHNALTSNAAPIHAPAISTFHRSGQSGLHVARTSRSQSPSHQLNLSNFHRSTQSGLHNNRTSQGRPPSHLPAISNFHRNGSSGQHQARTSGTTASPVLPKPPVHNPAISRGPRQPIHNPSISRVTKPPVHSAAQSRSTQRPKVPAHNPSRSNATRQPVHSAAQSRNTQKPKVPAHNPSRSNATKQPAHSAAQSRNTQKPKVPAHNPSRSNATKKPVHSAAQSRNTQKPKVPAHNPSLSNATRQPAVRQPVPRKPVPRKPVTRTPAPKKPIAKKPAPRKPVAKKPAAPAHNSSVSQARQRQLQQQKLLQQQQKQQQNLMKQLQQQRQQQIQNQQRNTQNKANTPKHDPNLSRVQKQLKQNQKKKK